MDQGRDIEGIGIDIAVADEPSTPRFENRSSGKDVSGDWTAVGHPIREMRGFDMTQAEFAERIGIVRTIYPRWKAEILLRISREFAKSVEWLLTGEG